jgi:hypothetical protein
MCEFLTPQYVDVSERTLSARRCAWCACSCMKTTTDSSTCAQLYTCFLSAVDAVKHKGLPLVTAEAFIRQLHLGSGEVKPPVPKDPNATADMHTTPLSGQNGRGDENVTQTDQNQDAHTALQPSPDAALGRNEQTEKETTEANACITAQDEGHEASTAQLDDKAVQAAAIASRYARICADPQIKNLSIRVADMSRDVTYTLMRQHAHVQELLGGFNALGGEVAACARDLGRVRHELANMKMTEASAERDKAQSQVCEICVCVYDRLHM